MSPFKKSSNSTQPARRRVPPPTQESRDTASRQSRLFQRGRTLTGSASSEVSSSAEHLADLRSPRVHAHHLARIRHRLATVLGLVLLAALGSFYLLSEFTASTTVTVNAAAATRGNDTSNYASIVDEYYARHPVERFRFALNNEQFLAYVQSNASEVELIAVRGTGSVATSEVSMTMRRPVASWLVNGKTLYVDAYGTAFAKNFYNDSAMVAIVDESGVPTVDGKTLTSERFLTFIGKLVGVAKTYNLEVTRATLPRDTTRQVEVQLTGLAYPVKYTIDRPVGEQAEDMVRSINDLKKRGITPGYLDVRVKEKSFYK